MLITDTFNPPGNPGSDKDSVLEIDDESMDYPKPGLLNIS